MPAVKVVRPRVSYADLQQAPEDGRRYELYDGEVFVVPAPMPRHQLVLLNLEDLLRAYTTAHGGAVLVSPIDILFSDYDVLQPDLVFFSPPRARLIQLDEPIRHAPDIAIEILSPSTAATDRGKKMQMFARYAVPECWIVDPIARTIEVYRLEGAAYVLVQAASAAENVRSATIAGLELPAERIFPANP